MKAFLLVALLGLVAFAYADSGRVQLAPVPVGSTPLTSISTNSGDATSLLRGTGGWNGGWWQAPLKYVTYTFDNTYELDTIQFGVDQLPDGYTQHQLIDQSGRVIATLSGYTKKYQVIDYKFPSGVITNSLKILTISSPSNTAWFNITITGTKYTPVAKAYHQVAPVPLGSFVPTTISSSNGDATALLRGTGAWNGGWWFPSQQVVYNFGSAIELDRIVLIIDQRPAGITAHELIDSSGKVLHTFRGNTEKFQELYYEFPPGTITNSLTIKTTESVSNAAWLSVTILKK